MCTNQEISNIPFIMRGNHVRVHGHKKDLLYITCIFHVFKYVVKLFLVSAILHHISLPRLLPKSCFKISFFQSNFLCSSFFNNVLVLVNVMIFNHTTTAPYSATILMYLTFAQFLKNLPLCVLSFFPCDMRITNRMNTFIFVFKKGKMSPYNIN